MLEELLHNQIKTLDDSDRLELKDLKRICKHTHNQSIFTRSDECTMWLGYVTKLESASSYVKFYFKGRNVTLHRLLYRNFIGELGSERKLRFMCGNSGICCNVTHLEMIRSTRKTYEQRLEQHIQFREEPNEERGTVNEIILTFD